jgi:M42 glutamyl aminopeptidase
MSRRSPPRPRRRRGTRALGRSVHALEPNVAVVVDVTGATDVPGGDAKLHGDLRLGAGPAIGGGVPLSQVVSDLLFEVVEQAGIAVVPEIYAGRTETDADAVHLTRGGVPTGLVSIPVRYLHTPNELVSLDDLEAAVQLLVAFAGRLRADVSFARRPAAVPGLACDVPSGQVLQAAPRWQPLRKNCDAGVTKDAPERSSAGRQRIGEVSLRAAPRWQPLRRMAQATVARGARPGWRCPGRLG